MDISLIQEVVTAFTDMTQAIITTYQHIDFIVAIPLALVALTGGCFLGWFLSKKER